MCNNPCFMCGDSDECELYQEELARLKLDKEIECRTQETEEE